MNRFPIIGEVVEVLAYQGKDLEHDRIGTVYHRNGEYIYIRLHKTGVEVECYTCELKERKQSMVSWTELIAIANKPNINGVVYTREALEDAFDAYMKKRNRLGQLNTALDIEVAEANISHFLDSVYWKGDNLYGTIKILKTPAGDKLLDIISMYSEGMTLGISGKGVPKSATGSKDLFENRREKSVDDLEICSVNVINKSLTNH